MRKIVDLEEARMLKHMRPLARVLYRLVLACRELVNKRTTDYELDDIREHLREFDRELNKRDG